MSHRAGRADEWPEEDEQPLRLAAILQLHRHSVAHVLLEGGRAVGRAALARSFHDSSPLNGGPFRSLDCGREGDVVLASLKAHFALGGAQQAGDPLRSLRHGTLFLDHIELLGMEAQRLLLAVLDGHGAGPEAWVGRLIAGSGVELKDGVSGERLLRPLLDCLDKVRWSLGPAVSIESA